MLVITFARPLLSRLMSDFLEKFEIASLIGIDYLSTYNISPSAFLIGSSSSISEPWFDKSMSKMN